MRCGGRGRWVAPFEAQVHGAHVNVNLQLLTSGRAGIPRPDLVMAHIARQWARSKPSLGAAPLGSHSECGAPRAAPRTADLVGKVILARLAPHPVAASPTLALAGDEATTNPKKQKEMGSILLFEWSGSGARRKGGS